MGLSSVIYTNLTDKKGKKSRFSQTAFQTRMNTGFKTPTVAPRAGAWIETNICVTCFNMSLVAPHTGAWIETLVNIKQCLERLVAPHTGAWIETAMAADFFGDVYGRSPGNQYFSGHSIKRHFPEPVLYSTLTIQWGKDNLRVFVSGSNDLTNGLAFCSLHKQLFAGGAFTFIPHNKQYVCQVSRLATGDRGLKEWLWRYHDHYLSRPNEPLATPKSEYVTWHRKEVFRGLPISF